MGMHDSAEPLMEALRKRVDGNLDYQFTQTEEMVRKICKAKGE